MSAWLRQELRLFKRGGPAFLASRLRHRVPGRALLDRLRDLPTGDGSPEVHVLLGAARVPLVLWMLASWTHCTGQRWTIVIHDDGTMSRAAVEPFLAAGYDVRVSWSAQADEVMRELLKDHPECEALRHRHPPFGRKLFDPALFAATDKYIVLDDDIIFFLRPQAVLDWCARAAAAPVFMRDVHDNAALTGEEAASVTGGDLLRPLNSGMCLLTKTMFSLDTAEAALRIMSRASRNPWLREQTVYALLGGACGGSLLPAAYRMDLSEGASSGAVCRHYVGAVRHLFWTEGVPRFLRGTSTAQGVSFRDEYAEPVEEVSA